MTDMHSIHYETAGVNKAGRHRWREAKKKRLEDTTATQSLLSEGEVFCGACRRRIDGEAVCLKKPRPGYRPPYDSEVVALLHPACYGWQDDE